MLDFLKKHQRKFFIVITVMTVSSFLFFGTFSTFLEPRQEMPDRQIVLNIAGKPLMKRELHALCQMLATSGMSASNIRQGGMPNLFNDGVIEKELLENGMSQLLAERYFTELKPELDARLKKMKHYRFYSHPQAQHIQALSVYQRFAPALVQHLELLKKQSDECTQETFALMVQLYQDQALLPSEMVRQMLLYQQQQQGVPPDSRLAQGDFSLFGFGSLEDWFGPQFVALNAQLIANAAALAEQKGYEVKKDEIRTDLFQNIYTGYKRIAQDARDAQDASTWTAQDMQNYFHNKIQQFGLDEKTALEAWRKVMLFRRLFSDVGGSVLIDSLAFKHFHEYSNHHAKIELYEMPSALQFHDFQTMLKFQVYLESVASSPQQLRTQLALPQEICSLDQIEKRFPELIERECEVEYAEVKKSALCSEISLRETWEWEGDDAHWALMRKTFSELSDTASNRQERLQALDALDSKRRLAIDTFARQQMIDAMPQKIADALEKAPMRKAKASLRLQGGQLPFLGVQDRTMLISLLREAPLSEEGLPLIDAADPLYRFSGDNEHFYRIKVIHRDDEKRILRFTECLADGTLDYLLNRRLEEAYPEARKKTPTYFQVDKGTWKPLKEVKDQVSRFLFSDLLKAIEESYKAQMGTLPGNAGELPLVFYSNYRLFSHMQQARLHLQSGSAYVEHTDPIAEQWQLKKTERDVARSDTLALPKEEIFALESDQWSAIQLGVGGALAFYKVIEQAAGNEMPSDQIKQGHEILSLDARKQLMQELIALIDQKKAIDIGKNLGSEQDEH